MALIECNECGKSISNAAKACPHCGAKPKRKTSRAGKYFIIVLLVIAGFMVIIHGDPEEKRLAAMTPEQRAVEEKRLAQEQEQQKEARDFGVAIYHCRASIEKSLKDPDSVQYTDGVESTPFVKGKNGTSVITIRLRAKNSFGGMIPAIYLCAVKGSAENWTVEKLTEIPLH